jgi:RimJ/RimL family protein N-acetyltransferase
MTVIATERLELRHFDSDDAAFVLRLVNEPSFLRYIGDRGVRSIADARRYIADGPVAGYERYGHGLLCVVRKTDGVAVGMCGVLKRDALPEPDLGFSFLPEHWSQGYAFESASAVLRHARQVLGLGRILAITTVDNSASIRLLGKLGFRFDRMITTGDDQTELRLFESGP